MAATDSIREVAPETTGEAAEMLREAAADPAGVRICGGGTKLGWGRLCEGSTRISTRRLDRVVEHNQGDFTLLVQAGARLDDLQRRLAEGGQRISLDPYTGPDGGATIGGVVATADAGPLRHRYGTGRDIVLGITVALADGTVAKSGGKVIKNVAGYDLAKLYSGSFGTLGMILQVALRLHPLPERDVTLTAGTDDPARLIAAVAGLSRAPLEPEAVDVRWAAGDGTVLVRLAGPAAEQLAARAGAILAETGLEAERPENPEERWSEQRRGQRADDGAIVRVSATASRLGEVLEVVAERGLSLVGRGVVGVSWITIPDGTDARLVDEIAALRGRLTPAVCAVLDAPESIRRELDVWGFDSPGEQRLMAAVRERFDPERRCNPGLLDGMIA
jgi:glycolate dehydrogenase FAD-binding subunit